jgi:hypothetical protein
MAKKTPATEHSAEAARLRLRNTLWLIINAHGGSFTLNKSHFKDYPGDEYIDIETSEDRAADTITFRATRM